MSLIAPAIMLIYSRSIAQTLCMPSSIISFYIENLIISLIKTVFQRYSTSVSIYELRRIYSVITKNSCQKNTELKINTINVKKRGKS